MDAITNSRIDTKTTSNSTKISKNQLLVLPLLTEAEHLQLVVEFNDTAADYPKDKCVHQLFEEQVEQTPNATALMFENAQLTYAELNAKSNQLAHHLQKLGVGPDVLVGICVERSLEMVVGLLGILKAGGAYVPLDPSYPKDRLAFMLEDAAPAVLLTQEKLLNDLPQSEARVLCLDRDWSEVQQEDNGNLSSGATPENLAYIIYTSGSTGKPKGVMIEHLALTNFLASMADQPGLVQTDVLLAVTTLSFDIAALEIFLPLVQGAKLAIVPREVVKDGEQLAAEVERLEVTVMQATPATWRLLVMSSWMKKTRLKVLCGGEALPLGLAHELLSRYDSLWNMYGPTETTIWSSLQRVEVEGDAKYIGRPIANTQAYVLDEQMEPVPIGVASELYIGGAGVARGYLNRPKLTAERFVANPFGEGRLYKTGDLVRWRADGNLEFLGRLDHQVKIRGFRIELGEIEAAILTHPAVREAVVVAREDASGDKRLVAHVVLEDEASLPSADLRQFLKEALPEYMVPSAFMVMDKLPLTPSGKLDRRGLPAPDLSVMLREGEYVAPRTPVEETLCEIWAEVLGVEQVGIYDNFFELGGHSLLATKAISRVRKLLNVQLLLRTIFEQPTVALIAECLSEPTAGGSSNLPLRSIARTNTLPLSFAQQRLWFLNQIDPCSSFYNISLAFCLTGPIKIPELSSSLNEIVRRHEPLHTTFALVEGEPSQIVDSSLTVVLPVVDLCGCPQDIQETEAERLINEEAQQAFDLEHGPLIRFKVLKLNAEEHILLLVKHHIVSDDWSLDIFFHELSFLYNAHLQGLPSPLTKPAIHYADYSVWQRERLQGKFLEQQLGYWREKLVGLPRLLELPTDRPRPAVQTFHGDAEEFLLPKPLTDAIKALAQREGMTLFMVLLAAFQVLLLRYTGQEDIVVGSPIAGRTQKETEDLIGFFVNTLPLRTDLSGDPSFRELLGRVKETCLGAYEHQELPFEKIVEELAPERRLDRNPLFQIAFALQGHWESSLNLTDIHSRSMPVKVTAARFDVEFHVGEDADKLRGWIEYNTDLFDADTIRRFLDHYRVLLEGITAGPEARLSSLPVLTEAERHQLIVEFNNTASDYPEDKCIHQLFEEQAEKNPDAVAVTFENEQLTYRELNVKANSLAHYLRELGVGPDVLVGICVERSLEMIVGLLGILKAGGAYVPLDPSYPKERLAFMLEDAAPAVLLTQEKLVGQLPKHEAQVLSLDRDWRNIQWESMGNLTSAVTSGNLSYVIYTSGSTGKPKGVMIEHRGVVNLIFDLQNKKPLHAGDQCSGWTTVNFDASVYEFFSSLLAGATLCLVEDAVRYSGPAYSRWLSSKNIQSAFVPVSMLSAYLDDLQRSEESASLRRLFVGVEPIDERLLCQISEQVPGLQIINAYGPTEITVCSSVYLVGLSCDADRRTPIGRPIANTQSYVLDRQMEPVPIGVAGELYIGGVGVGRGYLNRPELTAERFCCQSVW